MPFLGHWFLLDAFSGHVLVFLRQLSLLSTVFPLLLLKLVSKSWNFSNSWVFSVINNFASSVSFAITGNNRRDEKFPIDAMEALICVIGKLMTGLFCINDVLFSEWCCGKHLPWCTFCTFPYFFKCFIFESKQASKAKTNPSSKHIINLWILWIWPRK